MTTNHGKAAEQQPPLQPYHLPVGKISMWFGIATTPLLATSALLLMSDGDQVIVTGLLHFFVLIIVAVFGLVSLILGGVAVHRKHQEQHAVIGMWLTVLSALVGVGSFFVH